MIIAALDPGLSGALAVMRSPDDCETHDLPTMGEGTERMLDGGALARVLLRTSPDIAVIELVTAMPKQGLASTFRFGTAYGQILGVVQALQLPYELVRPQLWKRQMRLAGGDKEGARQRAIGRFPELGAELARKKDHNRAEALMLALWWWEQHGADDE